jgi:tetraacyldisaccharide 4'-kinase
VVSVGNLHWGGAGKTPLVAALAARLRDGGTRVAVLSRGYGRRGGESLVVSGWRQEAPVGPERAGDEPALLAGELPGVAVVVGADRHRAGLVALARLEPPPDLFLLDDGFSHLALARDLDLLAFPAADPLAGGRLPPGGRLREPLAAAARADAALLTGFGADAEGARRLREALAAWGFSGPVFAAPTRAGTARLADGRPLPAGARVLLVSAIARPRSFRRAAEEAGFAVAGELSFRDHHRYPEASLRRIAGAFAGGGAEALLTTGKDRVKLAGRLALPLAELPIRAEPEDAFWNWLAARLAAAGAGSRG